MEKGSRNANQIVAIFFICPCGGHLGFQNGCHFQHVLAYIWIFEPQNDLKMVAIPVFVIPWIEIKVFRNLRVISLLAAILFFQNGRHFQHILANIATSEVSSQLKMVAIPTFLMLSDVIKALWKVLKMAAILKSKMAATETNEKNGNNLICIPGSLLHHLRSKNQITNHPQIT